MKKFISLFILILFFKVNILAFYEFSFVDYPKQPSILFTHPAAVGLLNRFSIELGYGGVLRNILENNLYTSEIASNINFKSIFFGIGYHSFILEDIYLEGICIFNIGSSFFNKRLILASNVRYYLFKYIYDEYYEEEPLKDEQLSLYNLDFGILWNLNSFVLSFSGVNLLENKLGKDIKYTLPKKIIFNFSYKYNENSNISVETQFSQEWIDQRSRNTLEYKLGIAQRVFSSKIISCDVLATFKKSQDFTGFSFSLYNKFIHNKLGLRYIWYYPVVDIQNFLGNHYIVLSFEFGKETPTEKVKKIVVEKEVPTKEIKEVKEEKPLQPKVEIKDEPLPEKPQIKEVQISTPSVKTKEIKKQTLLHPTTSLQVITAEEKTEQLSTSKETNISTITLPSVSKPTVKEETHKKETIPQPEKFPAFQTYKFPLAHKVKEGETLVSISKKYYNTEKGWKKIYEANKDKIIKGVPIVGEILIIPEP